MKISFKNFNKTKILQILQKIKLNKDPNPKILQSPFVNDWVVGPEKAA